MSNITHILSRIDVGDRLAARDLLPLVYEELRHLARNKLAGERPGQTLQATALVHEAWLKLVQGDAERNCANRQHFFAVAAEAMRQILVDQARRKMAVRHGGDLERRDELPEVAAITDDPAETVALGDLLENLSSTYPRPAEVAKMRLCLQMSCVEIAQVLNLSPDTIETDWAFARAWLKRAWGRDK